MNVALRKGFCTPMSIIGFCDSHLLFGRSLTRVLHSGPLQQSRFLAQIPSSALIHISGIGIRPVPPFRKIRTKQISTWLALSSFNSGESALEGADLIASKGWRITEASGNNWRGHAAAIARSVKNIKSRIKWEEVLSKLKKLEIELEQPELWEDQEKSFKYSQQREELAARVKTIKNIENELMENVDLAELAQEETDLEVEAESEQALRKLRRTAEDLELAVFISGSGASLKVGDMDYETMIVRLYNMLANRQGFEVKLADDATEKASDGMEIKDADLVIERFRAGGPGGQHANKTESAVRIVHKPTGLTATSRSRRSQHQNKKEALEILQNRVRQQQTAKQAEINAQRTQFVVQPDKIMKILQSKGVCKNKWCSCHKKGKG